MFVPEDTPTADTTRCLCSDVRPPVRREAGPWLSGDAGRARHADVLRYSVLRLSWPLGGPRL